MNTVLGPCKRGLGQSWWRGWGLGEVLTRLLGSVRVKASRKWTLPAHLAKEALNFCFNSAEQVSLRWILGGGLRQGLTSPLQALPRTGSPANIPLQDTCPLTTSCLAQGAGEGSCHLPELAGEDRGTGAHKLCGAGEEQLASRSLWVCGHEAAEEDCVASMCHVNTPLSPPSIHGRHEC